NVSSAPARYLAVAFGGLRYPFSEDKRRTFTGMDVSVRDGGRQIEYEDQDPRIHALYLEDLQKRGIQPRMDEVPVKTLLSHPTKSVISRGPQESHPTKSVISRGPQESHPTKSVISRGPQESHPTKSVISRGPRE